MPEAANSMYGVPAVYSSSGYIPPATTTPVIPQVHILDRVANMEAMIVAFIAEHNLSFSLSEELIELSKELSRDTTALKRVKLHRTTSSYKLTFGLAVHWKNELVEQLRLTPFSINLDESTSSNTKHVFYILV